MPNTTHPSFFGVSIAIASLALVAFSAACTSSTGSRDASVRGNVNWSQFTPMRAQGLKDSTLQELENSVDFPFVLPSWLPDGLSKTFFLSTQVSGSLNYAGLELFPEQGSSAPQISIEERTALPNEHLAPGPDIQTISGTLVDCTVVTLGVGFNTSTVGTILRCTWVEDSVDFEAEFKWRFGTSKPEDVTPEMKRQADQVIASMISESDSQ